MAMWLAAQGRVCDHCGVRRHAALNPARKRSETRAHGVLARIHRRVRGGAIGVRALVPPASAPPRAPVPPRSKLFAPDSSELRFHRKCLAAAVVG